MKKSTKWIIIVAVILVAAGAGYYFFFMDEDKKLDKKGTDNEPGKGKDQQTGQK